MRFIGLGDGLGEKPVGDVLCKLPWQLERSGRWTSVEFAQDFVRFRARQSLLSSWQAYAALAVVGLLIALAYSIAFGWAIAIVASLLFLLNQKKLTASADWELIISPTVAQVDSSPILSLADIDEVVVRENTGRDQVEDWRLAQLVIRQRSNAQWTLVYQEHYPNRHKVEQVAQDLKAWCEKHLAH